MGLQRPRRTDPVARRALALLGLALLGACAAGPGLRRSSDPSEGRIAAVLETERLRDWDRLEAQCAEWQREAPQEYEALVCLSEALVEKGRPAEALGPLRRALALRPDESTRTPGVHFVLGRALLALGERPDEAEAHLILGLVHYPRATRAPLELAGLLADRGHYREALQVIERARPYHRPEWAPADQMADWNIAASWELAPDALVHYGQGGRALRRQEWKAARKEFEAALEIAPSLADAHRGLAQSLERLGVSARAEQEYRLALASYPAAETRFRAEAQLGLARLLIATAAPMSSVEALDLLRRATVDRPDAPHLTFALAKACDEANEVSCARLSFERFLSQMPGAEDNEIKELRAAVADRLAMLGCVQRAGAEGWTCVEDRAAALCEEGRRLAADENPLAAVKKLQAASALAPEHHTCWAQLAATLDDLDRQDEAEAAYRHVLAADSWAVSSRLRGETAGHLASLLIRRGSTAPEVLALARQARAAAGDKAFFVLVLGRACEVTGDRPCAIEAFRSVLSRTDASDAVRARAAERLREIDPAPAREPPSRTTLSAPKST